MAIQTNIACPVVIKIDTGTANALEQLGYSVNGCDITEQKYEEPIFSDENGGPQGPPVDIIHHGQVDVITFTSVRFDPAVAAKVQYVRGTTIGSAPDPCTLLFADGKTYRVLLLGDDTFQRNYLRVVVDAKRLTRIGAHATEWQVTLTCHKNADGVFFNSVTT